MHRFHENSLTCLDKIVTKGGSAPLSNPLPHFLCELTKKILRRPNIPQADLSASLEHGCVPACLRQSGTACSLKQRTPSRRAEKKIKLPYRRIRTGEIFGAAYGSHMSEKKIGRRRERFHCFGQHRLHSRFLKRNLAPVRVLGHAHRIRRRTPWRGRSKRLKSGILAKTSAGPIKFPTDHPLPKIVSIIIPATNAFPWPFGRFLVHSIGFSFCRNWLKKNNGKV